MPSYPVGPSHHGSRGPVLDAYAETDALSRPCPRVKGCGAPVNDFCTFPDGSTRHIPCIARTIREAS